MADTAVLADRHADHDHVAADVHASLETLADLYAYNHWFYARLRPFLRGRICDIGCGTGNFIQFLLNHEHVVGMDPYVPSLTVARERFRAHGNVDFVQAQLDDCPNAALPSGTFDTVVCLRVLDALPDDVDALRRMAALCRPGGKVVILAAAHASAYGTLDQALGHLRRYNRRTLGRAFRAAGLRVTHGFYMNALGYFGWLLHSRLLRHTQIPGGGARVLDRLVPVLDACERLLPPPFGQSLVMVGRPGNAPR
jgi:SAM-dependent methyltransferase